MSTSIDNENYWYNVYIKEFGPELSQASSSSLAKQKPVPLLWSAYFLESLKLEPYKGVQFSKRCVTEITSIMGENLTSIQELILSGDVEITKFQIEKLSNKTSNVAGEEKFSITKDKSALHYAVMSGNIPMIKMLLDYGLSEIVNKGDIISGFTPFHFALFIEDLDVMWLLLTYGASIYIEDKYSGTPLDYGRMLNMLPDPIEYNWKNKSIDYYESTLNQIQKWTINQFEQNLKVHWCPGYLCDHDYIEELMFCGVSIEKDVSFREKYLKQIEGSSGDQNLILSKIDDVVGYGVFAKKDFKKEEIIVRYGGFISSSKKKTDRAYSIASGIEGILLDSSTHRNLGGMINHCTDPNAQLECIFHRGAEHAVVIALKDIPKGQQILIDYSENYFGGSKLDFVDMSKGSGFPSCLPREIMD
eukprot:TRINITY_DN9823_c0_g1_i1.p1 TRINITY_DN9823_c0_g1~~TRINITY_DN9823_c0_g1_i1.p1  ORF type:complete len:417 (+),score=75.77 TRINITY_DN9823_c0_g1_i1:72-1322(+)